MEIATPRITAVAKQEDVEYATAELRWYRTDRGMLLQQKMKVMRGPNQIAEYWQDIPMALDSGGWAG